MKQTNLSLYLLCILCASFILFKCRASYGYSAAPVSAEITANDYALLRGPLKVIAEANLNPQSAKPLYYTPPGVTSSLPLAGLVSGAAGIAGLAYYQRTGVDPVYAAASAVASAADHIFVPAYQAFQDVFVSPESFPAAAGQYVGVEGSIGATVGDLVDFVNASASGLYDSLKSAIGAATVSSYNPVQMTTSPEEGVYIDQNDLGWNVIGWEFMGNFYASLPTSIWSTWLTEAIIYASDRGVVAHNGRLYTWVYFDVHSWHIYRSLPTSTTFNPDSIPPVGGVDYEALKASLINPSPAVSAEIKEVINDLPDAQKGVSSNPAPSSVPAQVQPAINQQQVQNFYAQNASSVANYNTTNITDNSTSTQIAQWQAATEAAQSKAAENLKIPDATFKGDAALPDANEYDPEFEQPEEEDFVDKVHSFINSGLPVISSIKASHLTASGSPQMSTSIWGHPINIDFSGQQTVLRAAGAVLVTISLILSYLVIVRS